MPNDKGLRPKGRAVGTRQRFEAHVRKLARDSGNVAIKQSYHAKERQEERQITDKMIFDVLQTGEICGEIEAGARDHEWIFKMTKRMKGRREVGSYQCL